MNQLNDAESGNMVNVDNMGDQAGAIGGQGLPPPPIHPPHGPNVVNEPANVNVINEYNSFNLANVTPPIAPKWKTSDTLLDDYHKFRRSRQRIFDRPVCHITSGKVKTNMFLIWAGPDGEDIYDSFNLPVGMKHNIELVMQQFEELCEPICNFRMAQFKFAKVHQSPGETIDMFYNRILRIGCKCDFTDLDECIINAIIFRTDCIKAQDKLLPTPKTLSLKQCLTVCCHEFEVAYSTD